MFRELVIKPAAVDAAAAAWIAANVLVRPQKNGKPRWAGPNLGETVGQVDDICECLYGQCGYCKDLGRHDQCSHRLGRQRRVDGHETWIISARQQGALTPVWVKQVFDGVWQPCRWLCSCQECERIGYPVLVVDGLPPARKRAVPGGEQPALF